MGMKRIDLDRQRVTRNSKLASLLVSLCRQVLPVRVVDPEKLKDIPPSHEGYLKIMKFYFWTNSSKYCFGRNYSGPNWFTRRSSTRKVAIFMVFDEVKNPVYNQFAVSGEHKT